MVDLGALTEIELLQPVDLFLDTAGEGLRARLFVTEGEDGEALCLRPEFTIPLCQKHIASGAPEGRYAYRGDVFRRDRAEGMQYVQAGVELVGGAAAQNDAALLAEAISVLPQDKLGCCQLNLGDQALFEQLLAALNMPNILTARLAKDFGHSKRLEQHLEAAQKGADAKLDGLSDAAVAAIEADDETRLVRAIEAEFQAAGLPLTGGRRPQHVAARLLARSRAYAQAISAQQAKIISDYLQLDCALSDAPDLLSEFAKGVGIELDASCLAVLAEAVPSGLQARFKAGFGRPMEYYSGLIFEIEGEREALAITGPVVYGGRYDGLLSLLGAKTATQAIGFAVALDRLAKMEAVR